MMHAINFGLVQVRAMVRGLTSRVSGERGQDLIEYALLSGLIAAAIIAVGVLGYEGALNSMAAGISNCVDFKKSTTCNPF
jgi:Flp pilus assembly pilin Flp